MKKKLLFSTAVLTLALLLTACTAEITAQPAAPQEQQTPQEPQTQQEQQEPITPDAQEEPVQPSIPNYVTDAFVLETVIRLPELALSDSGFVFEDPQDLSAQQLYLLFLAWSAPEELDRCFDTAAGVYVFDSDVICQTLDRYLQGYTLDLTQCTLYDAGRSAVVTPMASGFGGDLAVTLTGREYDGSTAVFTADLDGIGQKSYTVRFYDGGFRYLSVRLLSSAPARMAAGDMTLNGAQIPVFADINDEEFCIWDSAIGGRLLAVARFPQTLPGAADALEGLDYTDLDGDGNSELAVEFTFSDGSTASLLWFYTNGGLVYNEEFSRLPGEPSAAGSD